MDELHALLNSMKLAADEREQYIKSLEEKNKRLSIENERMVKEKNIQQNQFIECHQRLNHSNDLVRRLENIINPELDRNSDVLDDDFPDDLSISSSDSLDDTNDLKKKELMKSFREQPWMKEPYEGDDGVRFSLDDINDLKNTINDLITCQICYEQFQSDGEHIPCKLKCPHIMCKKCAKGWITTQPISTRVSVHRVRTMSNTH